MTWLDIVRAIAVAAICAYSCRYYLHMMQLESYQTDGYQRWLSRHREKLFGWTLNIGVIATIAAYVLELLLTMLFGTTAGTITTAVIMLIAFAGAAMALARSQYKTPEKKPLVLTARMKRLYAAVCLIALAGSFLLVAIGIPNYLLFVGVPYIVLIAAKLTQPIEKRVNRFYLNLARVILEEREDLIRIGITGSFGKTSTKFILAAILSEKFDVLATPSSFNTPMGLTRVIREQLEPHHQVFIAEMGARHAGDIKELCDLVHPRYGVLTSVGEQHLETFGNIDTIANTKYELIEGLEDDGVGFFAADGAYVDRLYERATCEKYRVGIGSGYLSMYAEDIKVGPFGSRFTLCESDGERVRCETKLLGLHNISNIVVGCAVARRLGMTMDEIARGVKRAEPVEHRLQMIRGAGEMIIIDDAFNSNPVGASAALDVLGAFHGRRLIVTPGMVEQGEKENELNFRFGTQMDGKADIVILVGKKHTQPIAQGLLSTGFDQSNLHIVANLEEAQAVLAQIGRPKDIILFENDLPDNYAE